MPTGSVDDEPMRKGPKFKEAGLNVRLPGVAVEIRLTKSRGEAASETISSDARWVPLDCGVLEISMMHVAAGARKVQKFRAEKSELVVTAWIRTDRVPVLLRESV